MKVEGKANIHNRFTFEVKHIDTGKVEIYKAENIVLDACFTRLVNFNPYFTHIHVGTGTGGLAADRTQLFDPIDNAAAKKACVAGNVVEQRALPTSRRQRRVIIAENELVGEELTEVGIAYGADNANLCTHALIEDSEGAPISLTKTDTMVVTIYADVFIELGDIDAMYEGKWRWVHPLANNQLLSYLLGATYPTQQFRVSVAPEFYDGSNHPALEGVAPTSHGQSDNITTANWTPNTGAKKTVTPERRLGISVGNGEVRCFGLGSSNTLGTFRGQLPITGVFESQAVVETIGTGDGTETGFNLSWNDPSSLVIKNDTVVVDGGDYTVGIKENTNLFSFKPVEVVEGSISNPHYLTDNDSSMGITIGSSDIIGIDVGVDYASVDIKTFRYTRGFAGNSRTIYLHGSDNTNYSDSVLLANHNTSSSGTFDISISPAVSYRYYTISVNSVLTIQQVSVLSADNQIVFDTAPGAGEIITAEYNVDYIPKDTDHVLDLQCAIQYGEG